MNKTIPQLPTLPDASVIASLKIAVDNGLKTFGVTLEQLKPIFEAEIIDSITADRPILITPFLGGINFTFSPNANVSFNAFKITNLADGTGANDAINLGQLTSGLAGKANTAHTHLAADVTNFQSAVSANTDVAANTAATHTHANKALLDTYTQTEANLADAVAKKHTQNSDTFLAFGTADQITASEARAFIDSKGQALGLASLDGGGKVPVTQLPSSIMEYQGIWNATTNSPSLADGAGSTGDVYRVSVAGIQDLGSGNISFEVGDYIIYNGTIWEKSDTTDAVASVNGFTGVVTLTTSHITEGSNLYFTEARVLGTDLAGFSSSNSVISATDTIIEAFGKAQGQITAKPSGSGTTNSLTKWTASGTIGNSILGDNGIDILANGDVFIRFRGTGNTLIGEQVGNQTGNWNYNTGVGRLIGANFNTAEFNAILGDLAAGALTNGKRNSLFGASAAGNITTASDCIIIGYDIDAQSATLDGQLSIGNLIFGTGLGATGTTISTGSIGIGSISPLTKLQVSNTSTSAVRGIMSAQYSTTTDGARYIGRKARGTEASPTIIVTGDSLASLIAEGYDGTNYLQMGMLRFSAAGTIGTGRVPTAFSIWTATDEATSVLTERFTILPSGNVGIATNNPIVPFQVNGVGNQAWIGQKATATQIDGNTFNARIVVGNSVDTGKSGHVDIVGNEATGGIGNLSFGNYNISATEKRIAIIYTTLEGVNNTASMCFATMNAGTIAEKMILTGAGKLGIGVSPTAMLHIKAGTATAGTGQIVLDSGTLLTTAVSGTIERDGDWVYLTTGSTAKRNFIATGGRTATATNYTALPTDRAIGVTSTAAARTITLMAANSVPAGFPLVITDESNAATVVNTITIAPAGADTIIGGTVISAAGNSRTIYSDGVSKWFNT